MAIDFATRGHRGDSTGSYNGPEQTHEYTYDPGVIVLPVAGPLDDDGNPRLVYIRVHNGYGTRRVPWAVNRSNKPPIIPAMKENLDNDRLVGGSVNFDLPQPDPTQVGWNWSVRGVYEYVQKKARVVGRNPFPTGRFPYPVQPMEALAADALDGVSLGATFEEAVEALAAVIDHRDESYIWPFVIHPAEATTDDAIIS